MADHMLDMSIEPSLEEQELLEETLRRPGSGMSRREILAVVLSAAGFLAAVAGVWAIQDPDSFSIAPAVVCLLVLALSMRVRFDTPLGFTVPTQLAFVPLVFAAPLAIVPIAVVGGVRGGDGPRDRDRQGPAEPAPVRGLELLVLDRPRGRAGHRARRRHSDAGPLLLLAALAAQFAVDFAAGVVARGDHAATAG